MKKKFDVVIMAAAPADYTPSSPSKSKIKSKNAKMTVKLVRVPKIIDSVKKLQKDVFCNFLIVINLALVFFKKSF